MNQLRVITRGSGTLAPQITAVIPSERYGGNCRSSLVVSVKSERIRRDRKLKVERYLSPAKDVLTNAEHFRSLNLNTRRGRSSTVSSYGSSGSNRQRSRTHISLADTSTNDSIPVPSTASRQRRLYSLPAGQSDVVSTPTEETVRRFASTLSGTFKNIGDSRRKSTLKSSLLASNLSMQKTTSARKKIEVEIIQLDDGSVKEFTVFHIVILGSQGSGKRSILRQFASSEYKGIYSFTHNSDTDQPHTIPVMIDDDEIRLQFLITDLQTADVQIPIADTYLVVYDTTNRKSFTLATAILRKIRGIPAIVVANKVDMVRSRAVSKKDGYALSKNHNVKFIETSAALNENIDQLLAGCVRQIQKDRSVDAPEKPKANRLRAFLSRYFTCMLSRKRFDPEDLY